MTAETLRILVVDDEPYMRQGIERALSGFCVHFPEGEEEVHYVVESAHSAEDGLERIAAASPDILLLDHKLPGISGLEMLQRLLEEKREVLTIMITAYASIETAVTATKRGAYDFLPKPFTPEEVKAAVRKATKHLLLKRQAARLAEEKRQVRFQFISVLAHELKAPLAAVEGYVQLLKDARVQEDPEAYRQMVDRCQVRLQGMRKLIVDLLDLTRIEAGTKKRELAEINLPEVARLSIETVQPEAVKRGIVVELNSPPRLPILADRSELEIILNNLISNAVKYNKDGGRVTVTLGAADGFCRIQVADTGIGLSAEEQAKLFQDFVRIKNAKTRNILGSGLGLSILKKLTALYGGRIELQSKPDVGSTFTVWLQSQSTAQSFSAP